MVETYVFFRSPYENSGSTGRPEGKNFRLFERSEFLKFPRTAGWAVKGFRRGGFFWALFLPIQEKRLGFGATPHFCVHINGARSLILSWLK